MRIRSDWNLAGCLRRQSARRSPTLHRESLDCTTPEVGAASLTVEGNSVVLRVPASMMVTCSGLLGDYVRQRGNIEVRLRQGPPDTPCTEDDRPAFITRIGPLPAGSYDVSVTLDGKPLIRGEGVRIS